MMITNFLTRLRLAFLLISFPPLILLDCKIFLPSDLDEKMENLSAAKIKSKSFIDLFQKLKCFIYFYFVESGVIALSDPQLRRNYLGHNCASSLVPLSPSLV